MPSIAPETDEENKINNVPSDLSDYKQIVKLKKKKKMIWTNTNTLQIPEEKCNKKIIKLPTWSNTFFYRPNICQFCELEIRSNLYFSV